MLHRTSFATWLIAGAVALAGCGDVPELIVGNDSDSSDSDDGDDAGNSTGGTVLGIGGENNQPEPEGGASGTCDEDDPDCEYVAEGPACGDGVVDDEEGELCDDGNSQPGDGCTGGCSPEPNFSCPPDGGACVSTVICGDGLITGDEVCDVGAENEPDPGCTSECRVKAPDYDCTVPGEPCVDLVECGDGLVTGSEACDDAGAANGCSDTCDGIESGWVCLRPGQPCVFPKVPVCGDGLYDRGEQCDEGSANQTAGCVDCQTQTGWLCPAFGASCIQEVCGNGVRTANEECDDANDDAGDGCSTGCAVETGWVCPNPGGKCIPACGDGILTDYENCEDGNKTGGDGCSASCLLEPGYFCVGAQCVVGEEPELSSCGNSVREAEEGCDDGNQLRGDGCTPDCVIEPTFTGGTADVVCGDGAKVLSEECDDGNTANGDGCDSTCHEEDGFVCSVQKDDPSEVRLPVTYRDFYASNEGSAPSAQRHPDFERGNYGARSGIAGYACSVSNAATDCASTAANTQTDHDCCGRLDASFKPQLNPRYAVGGFRYNSGLAFSNDSFRQWYRDTPVVPGSPATWTNVVVNETMVLRRVSTGVYQFDSVTDSPGGQLFPLNGRGFRSSGDTSNNFHFTTELRYFFQYEGGERLDFSGDDDVYIYVNGRLAIDLGGVHGRNEASVVLGDLNGNLNYGTSEQAQATDTRFGITKGGLYEIRLFHAERHTSESNFKLTLSNFILGRSICTPECGDGVVTRGEVCDDGEEENTGDYGACSETCSGRIFCGDGIQQADEGEQCDDGKNVSPYDSTGCAPGCVIPPRCGDSRLDVVFAEACDDGDANNDGSYEGCNSDCTLAPFCGDGVQQSSAGEVCDDGAANGGYGTDCSYECQPSPYCGDGVRNGPELCDLGTASNDGSYGACNPNCTPAPRCGDGEKQEDQGETCDNGVNSGAYGDCTSTCKLGPRCGDGIKNGAEKCDDGVNDGGYGECAPNCQLGPRCGDKIKQTSAGETCDDGNAKSGDGCSKSCRLEVLVPR